MLNGVTSRRRSRPRTDNWRSDEFSEGPPTSEKSDTTDVDKIHESDSDEDENRKKPTAGRTLVRGARTQAKVVYFVLHPRNADPDRIYLGSYKTASKEEC